MAEHNELGKKGEALAVDFLLQKKYVILERNYRFEKAEVDIIAKQGEVLAIVEVKTRSSKDFGNPQDFVKPKQIQRLVKAVDEYVKENADRPCRDDDTVIGNGANCESCAGD